MTKSATPRFVAFHEAGHACVAQALGRRVEAVCVGPFGGGLMRQEPLDRNLTAADLEATLTIIHAGPLAAAHA